MSQIVNVALVYASPDRQHLVQLELAVGNTVGDALSVARGMAEFDGIDFTQLKTGIFGHVCKSDRCLQDGDRIELYRPLIADPKEARHRRVALGKTMRKA
ncbi:RnfH family protein [Chitinimonas sp. BJYL2]|uniref:RnfH family protein n=1 Tax=Chitinimonas sp. BJYL2 TaxID=2976696 RepID=UPI0022B32E38|nr:RnfH family protein [Chitinimonas sp. BJYL2]